MMPPRDDIVETLQRGGMIAYPTEAVYGLGCDAYNESAVQRLSQIKKRPSEKGFIVLIHTWEQLAELTAPLTTQQLTTVKKSWPGPVTWIFPANTKIPSWLAGKHNNIAIRMTAHPIARYLCKTYQHPIISTSANISNMPPARTAAEVSQQFSTKIDLIIPGDVGNLNRPTPIFNILTGQQLRV